MYQVLIHAYGTPTAGNWQLELPGHAWHAVADVRKKADAIAISEAQTVEAVVIVRHSSKRIYKNFKPAHPNPHTLREQAVRP